MSQARYGRKKKLMGEINVVPYIDVMLVLLVIFMATAPLLTQGVQVDLPKAPSEPIAEAQNDPLVISMRADGAIFLNLGMSDAVIPIPIGPGPYVGPVLRLADGRQGRYRRPTGQPWRYIRSGRRF